MDTTDEGIELVELLVCNKGPILAPFLALRFWHWESRDTPGFPGFISGSLYILRQCITSKDIYSSRVCFPLYVTILSRVIR